MVLPAGTGAHDVYDVVANVGTEACPTSLGDVVKIDTIGDTHNVLICPDGRDDRMAADESDDGYMAIRITDLKENSNVKVKSDENRKVGDDVVLVATMVR